MRADPGHGGRREKMSNFFILIFLHDNMVLLKFSYFLSLERFDTIWLWTWLSIISVYHYPIIGVILEYFLGHGIGDGLGQEDE